MTSNLLYSSVIPRTISKMSHSQCNKDTRYIIMCTINKLKNRVNTANQILCTHKTGINITINMATQKQLLHEKSNEKATTLFENTWCMLYIQKYLPFPVYFVKQLHLGKSNCLKMHHTTIFVMFAQWYFALLWSHTWTHTHTIHTGRPDQKH